MKSSLLVLAIACGAVGIVTPASAQNYPWCAQYAGFGSLNCGYTTYAQCMASLLGNGGFCNANTQYAPMTPVPRGERARS
jgi:Protein of unknown function (DUF3551)